MLFFQRLFLLQALCYKKYSTCSDVWSYGALMFEIWSVGHKPFEERANSEVNLQVIHKKHCVALTTTLVAA